MEAWRDGEVRAFDQLFDRYRDMLYGYLVRQLGNPAAADEVFQDVWAALIKNRQGYTVRAKFRTYLFQIVHTKLIDYYRQFDRHSALSYEQHAEQLETASEEQDCPAAQVDQQGKLARLFSLLEQLPAVQRDIFLMHEESGLGLSEIAEVMNISRDTAKSRLRYAVEKLRRGMRHYQ